MLRAVYCLALPKGEGRVRVLVVVTRGPKTPHLNPLPFRKGRGEYNTTHRVQSDFARPSTICTTKLFFSAVPGGDAVAGGDDPGSCAVIGLDDSGLSPPPIDAIAARNSCSRVAGISIRMESRPRS